MSEPDVNFESHWQTTGLIVESRTIPPLGTNPKAYSDILKFSDCTTTVVSNCTIFCGKENASDAVRGEGYLFQNIDFVTTSPSFGALTIKGAINGWTLDNCRFNGVGDKYDVEVGAFDNYWYPGRPPTRNGTIKDCICPFVILWDAEEPAVIGSDAKVRKISKIIWFPYFLFRYVQIRITNALGITNIKTK
jgi:hypothetical protein